MGFQIEMDTLDNAIAVYTQAINDLNSNLTTLNSSLTALKGNAWKGKAKDSFMTLRYGEWEKGLREHISRLTFLNSMLKEARNSIEDLVTEGEQL